MIQFTFMHLADTVVQGIQGTHQLFISFFYSLAFPGDQTLDLGTTQCCND